MADSASVDLRIPGLGPAVRIGSGGFADVYRAQQTNLRREVAVKVLRAAADDHQSRMRFERECHAVGAVSNHPNIVAVHEGGFTEDGRAYLVMEFFPGGSLLDRLERSGPLGATEVIDVGLKIGRALGVAHQAGVLHRDVKPANILVSSYGEPALADFGIARVDGGQQTATGMVTASFVHAAPEVLAGGAPSAQSDLYSLGSTLFELFTGAAPHFRPSDESVWALMNRVMSESVPDPASVGMPEPLASTTRRATVHDHSDRFPTASDFVAALEGQVSASGSGPAVITAPSSPPLPPSSARPPDPAPALPPTPPGAQTPNQPSAASAATEFLETNPQPQLHAPDYASTQLQPTAFAVPTPHVETASDSFPPGSQGTATTPVPVESPRRARRLLVGILVVGVAVIAGLGTWFALQRSATVALGDVTVEFSNGEGAEGPLDVGQGYKMTIRGIGIEAGNANSFQLLVDGEPVGPVTIDGFDPFVPEVAGRHSVAYRVTKDEDVVTSDPIEVYVIGELPEAGLRANLGSLRATPGNWPATLREFDRLIEAGHDDLQLLPSDRFATGVPGNWNLFVPGFGQNRVEAQEYCDSFELFDPDDCFVGAFDPTPASG